MTKDKSFREFKIGSHAKKSSLVDLSFSGVDNKEDENYKIIGASN